MTPPTEAAPLYAAACRRAAEAEGDLREARQTADDFRRMLWEAERRCAAAVVERDRLAAEECAADDLRRRLADVEAEAATLRAAVERERREHEATRREVAALRGEVAAAVRQETIGIRLGTALRVARREEPQA